MISNPNRLHGMSHDDARNPIASCPARQNELYVVPARYALAEHPARHASLQPAVRASSHPMALRRLRGGFLYLWHGQGPLQRYAVAADGLLQSQPLTADESVLLHGSQAGFALDKRHDAWLLYSEIPLGADACAQLAEAGIRQRRMRHVALGEVALRLQAPHCPPLDASETLLAELMPEVRERVLAKEHAQNREADKRRTRELAERMKTAPTQENVRAYIHAMEWYNARSQAAMRHPRAEQEDAPGAWSAQVWEVPATSAWLDSARSEAGELHAVLAALDDDLGVLRDLNHEQEQLEARHEAWMADNNLRQNVGGFIRSLVREDGGELASLLNYRYREHDIQLTPEQGEQLLAAQAPLKALLDEETQVNVHERQRIGHAAADERIADIARRREHRLAPLRAFIPAELQQQVQDIVRDYRQDKASQLAGGRASAKVAEYIDLERMDRWLDEQAPAHFRQVEARHASLYADRQAFLPRHDLGSWFVEHDNPQHQCWLDELADACLSAQCHRRQGVEQFSDFLRAEDGGVFRLLFLGWSPSLEAAVNNTARLGELQAALAQDNLSATHEALTHLLGAAPVQALQRLASDVDGYWSLTVARLGAVLLALQQKGVLPGQWLGTLLVTRLSAGAPLVRTLNNGVATWRLLGQQAQQLGQWVNNTAQAIGQGRAAGILQSPAVQNSGGLLPLAALLVNALNAESYLAQAHALERMDTRRRAESISATLYAGAALVAVVQNWVIVGRGVQEFTLTKGQLSFVAPTLTLFGGIVGAVSQVAAIHELMALREQIETTQGSIDPWLELRRLAVTGQVAAFGSQATLGLGLTLIRLAKRIDTPTAIRRFRLGMGPINLLLLALGGVYLYAWWRQSTPLQQYLANCCWSKARAGNTDPIPAEQQQREFDQLLILLYQPRVSVDSKSQRVPGSLGDTVSLEAIQRLTIDLPGAEPSSVELELGLIGSPIPDHFRMLRSNDQPNLDIGDLWLERSQCTWIPADQGQGLRLSGAFRQAQVRLSLRLRYRNPLVDLAGITTIGGRQGVAYVLTAENAPVTLRPGEPTPELDRAQTYRLTGESHLHPKETR
ncbi:toxin VasX [Pseudomonas citronellolis]|uniref:toxin VasX n=1 Tax=Pseudomonas citronellolis TaxID=53408 RepID=UPI0021BEA063|nr:toxin VasX [Pseudomonas citronellolis]UXJ55680.1 hypothetical protein N5P21_16160 [Pseudomonas citronellolis]